MNNEGFYDFHTHTVFSDGGMIPAGLMQRALVRGCLGLAITDHVDSSNLEWAFENLLKFVEELGQEWQPGIGPEGWSRCSRFSRRRGCATRSCTPF